MANVHDKTEYVIHIRDLKQVLNYRLVLKKVNRILKFNQNFCLNHILIWALIKLHCIQKTNDIYKDIAEDVKTRFDTSNYELDRPLTNGKNKKVIWLMKNELDGKIMKIFLGLRAKTL